MTPNDRTALGFKFDFVWRGIALLASIELAAIITKRSEMPIGSLVIGAVLWAFIGYKPKRPVMAAAVTSIGVLALSIVFWSLPWAIAVFVPIWALLNFVPLAAGLVSSKLGSHLRRLWGSRGWVIAGIDRLLTKAERFPRSAEFCRICASILGSLAAVVPFFHKGIMGGDDSRWYSSVVADHLLQWRSGMGPVFVGQTRYAALGTVMPLRVAPYLQHLTLALDYATGQSLPPYLLINIAIVVSAAVGGLSAYLCLRSILTQQRTEACLLALLYIWCPAVIGLVYNGQLFMSAMTWPFLPLVFLGVVKICERQNIDGWLILAASCAICWLCHSPIGLWATIAAVFAVMVRWLSGYFDRKDLLLALVSSLVFAVLSGYAFVSVASLSPDGTPAIAVSEVVATIRASVPGIFLPLSPSGSALSDYQPGYSLWILLGLCLGYQPWRQKGANRPLAATAVLLLLLLFPIPVVNNLLWHSVPQFVIEATNRAPGQRLYALLAACSVILAASVLRTRYSLGVPQRAKIVLILILAVGWSGFQLRTFVARGALLSNSEQASDDSLSPQNLSLSRYSLGLLSEHNRFFSNGVVDYNLEQRVLGQNLRTYIVTNVDAVAPGFDGGPRLQHSSPSGELLGNADPTDGHFIVLSPKLRIDPNSNYLLIIDFKSGDYDGVLEVKGKGIHREYTLPMSGELFAFGATRFASRAIPLSNRTHEAIDLTLTFINQGPDADAEKFRTFAKYELVRYDPERLPIRLKSLLPYLADVRSPSPGWLETFRYFSPGWRAEVNGRPAPVCRSWNQLVAIQINAGENSVRLTYEPSIALVAAYWITWIGWALLLLAIIVRTMICIGRQSVR